MPHDTPDWHVAPTPFDDTLTDVTHAADGPYAVGDGGTLVADTGDGWTVVLDDGPAASDHGLRAIDATDGGDRVWFLGDGGALGCYDVTTGRKYDYSRGDAEWTGVAVTGSAGAEKALAATASGAVRPFTLDGFDVDWEPTTKPGSGASIAALAAAGGRGYAADTTGSVYVTGDDGWRHVGVPNAQVAFHDLWAGADGRVYVAGGDGRLYRYDDSYRSWTPIDVAHVRLRAVGADGHRIAALGADDTLYRRDADTRWHAVSMPTDATLRDVALGPTDVIVGAHGTVLERDRTPDATAGGSADRSNAHAGGNDAAATGAHTDPATAHAGGNDGTATGAHTDPATSDRHARASTHEQSDARPKGGTHAPTTGGANPPADTGRAGRAGSATDAGARSGPRATRERTRPHESAADPRLPDGRAPSFLVPLADADAADAFLDAREEYVVAEDACGRAFLVVLERAQTRS